MANLSELLARRTELIAELSEIDKAISAMKNPAAVWEIDTHRNIRNTYGTTTDADVERKYGDFVLVFADRDLTTPADSSAHGGYISGEAVARLRQNGLIDDDMIRVREVE